MYNSLRDVASQELYDSYRGILRISPNIIDNIEEDDTKYFFNPENNATIILSDSDGTLIESLSFLAKSYPCTLVDAANIDLAVITHNYSKLNVSKNFVITSSLDVTMKNNNKISITNDTNSTKLLYPIDSPYDKEYCNIDNKLNIQTNYDDEIIENAFSNKNLLDLISSSYEQVLVDGQPIFRESTSGTLIPEVYRHDYILGHSAGGTYNDNGKKTTQLSFISLDKMIWEKMSANLKGLYRHIEGRYKNLGDNKDEEIMQLLFGSTELDLTKKAPIIGVPVQSGTITYNAMPIRRYFFHLSENSQNDTDSASSSYIKNLISEYALCDGRKLKDKNNTTAYTNINKNSKKWKNFSFPTGSNAIKDEYYGIWKSSIDPSQNTIYTPCLFEMDQLSSRFLRGLNWVRKDENIAEGDENFTPDHSKRDVGLNEENDKGTPDEGTIVKNLYLCGPYYANHDYRIRKVVDHHHLALIAEDAVPSSAQDKFFGKMSYAYHTGYTTNRNTIVINSNHSDYKDNSTKKHKPWHGTYVLRTSGTAVLDKKTQKELSDAPIAYNGGTRANIISTGYSWKVADDIKVCVLGKCKCWCHNNETGTSIRLVAPGFFQMRAFEEIPTSWRTISSLQVQNKYGEISESQFVENKSTATWDDGSSTEIDDTLPSPTCINFIPLMKI